ncbi:MAG TPA: hypothetical protein VMT89_07660, partial [Candidatus Acidoferrales bacterium]|nr:hypothetical protein [Candidatus Acidoferrales bacterium]
SISTAKKATDKKPRAKADKPKTEKVEGPTTLAYKAGCAFVRSKKFTADDLADREVSKRVREAMRAASPDAADATIATQYARVKREYLAESAAAA